MERETGIEPATNSLEGCDSTTELLPPFSLAISRLPISRCHLPNHPITNHPISNKWWGGEGSNLRSPKAAGLQPAAIDRSATSPSLLAGAPPPARVAPLA